MASTTFFFAQKLNIFVASKQMIDQRSKKNDSHCTLGGNGPWSCCNHRLEFTVKYFARKINETDHKKSWFHKV
jgi:hypothetical protein